MLLLLLNIISEINGIYIFKLEIYVTFICKSEHLIKRAYTMCTRTIKYSNEVWVCKEASIYFSKEPKALSYTPKDAVRAVYVLPQESQDFWTQKHLCTLGKQIFNK